VIFSKEMGFDCVALVGILWIAFVNWSHSANGATLNKLESNA